MKAKLGQLAEKEDVGKKEAFHLPVIVMRARNRMRPGDPVSFYKTGDDSFYKTGDDSFRAQPVAEGIGVVDPFLDEPVEVGQYCVILMRPGAVKHLSHTWKHSALGDDLDVEPEDYWCGEYGCGARDE